MKKFFFLFILLSIFSCQPKDLPTVVYISPDASELKVSHMTTKAELDKIKEDLSKIGVMIDYSKSTFFEDGKLRLLSLAVALPNGQLGTCGSDLMGLQFRYFGFRYDKNNSGNFKVGTME